MDRLLGTRLVHLHPSPHSQTHSVHLYDEDLQATILKYNTLYAFLRYVRCLCRRGDSSLTVNATFLIATVYAVVL